jgi:cell division protein FtsQ
MRKRRIIILFVGLVLLIIFIAVTLSFAAKERKNALCTGVDVFFEEKEQFIPRKEIENIVYNSVSGLKSRKLISLNTEAIERQIEKHAWVKNAEVFIGYQNMDGKFFAGRLKVWIDQREPFFRVMTDDGGYYVDTDLKKVPFSYINTSKVVVCTGTISRKMIDGDLTTFINYINEDKFWKAQIEQVHVKSNGELVLVPRAGGHLIELGRVEKLDQKFRNLMAFYKQGFKNGGWDKYRRVSLRFDNQIVCTRK